MVDKKSKFLKAEKDLRRLRNSMEGRAMTYGQVMAALNRISKGAGTDVAAFERQMKNRAGRTICGFTFDTAELGQKLAELLDALGFSYERHYKKVTPQGKGEIHIAASQTKAATELFEYWSSWVTIEPMRGQHPEIQKKWGTVVTLSR